MQASNFFFSIIFFFICCVIWVSLCTKQITKKKGGKKGPTFFLSSLSMEFKKTLNSLLQIFLSENKQSQNKAYADIQL